MVPDLEGRGHSRAGMAFRAASPGPYFLRVREAQQTLAALVIKGIKTQGYQSLVTKSPGEGQVPCHLVTKQQEVSEINRS
jgi:hypothetical protein